MVRSLQIQCSLFREVRLVEAYHEVDIEVFNHQFHAVLGVEEEETAVGLFVDGSGVL